MENFINDISFISPVEWLAFSTAILLIVNVMSFYKQRKQLALQAMSIKSLQQDLRALANAAVGVGGRVLKVERQQRNLTVNPPVSQEKNKPVELNAPVDFYKYSDQPYEQAILMAQKGIDADTIANVTGLSESESNLVCVMHRLDKAS